MLFLTSNLKLASLYSCLVPAIDGKVGVAAFFAGYYTLFTFSSDTGGIFTFLLFDSYYVKQRRKNDR